MVFFSAPMVLDPQLVENLFESLRSRELFIVHFLHNLDIFIKKPEILRLKSFFYL